MPPSDLLISFLAATVIFAFTPGPGMLYMAVQAMAHGTRAGLLSSVAFHLASYLHIASAAFGVTVLLNAAPSLLVLLKVVGGGYLIWMGLRLWMQKTADGPVRAAPRQRSSGRAFQDSLVVEVLNPKSALFYLAFLPQFTSPESVFPIWGQILLLGIIANVAFSLADAVCIAFARIVAVRAAARAATWGRRIGGAILISMGARIAADAR
ncbi:MAG: LysE family translocator [Pseudomonadota bacterium]